MNHQKNKKISSIIVKKSLRQRVNTYTIVNSSYNEEKNKYKYLLNPYKILLQSKKFSLYLYPKLRIKNRDDIIEEA